MDWLKGVQEIVPWLAGIPPIPKTIVSIIIVAVAGFVLALIWTPSPPPPEEAIKAILANCYRRAMFTRMHAQLDQAAMFASIEKCREILQQRIPEIRQQTLQATAVELLATVEQMERRNPVKGSDDVDVINKLKVAALHDFRELAAATGGRYALPDSGKLGEAIYFTEKEADAPLSLEDLRNQIGINPATGEGIPTSK